MAVVDQSGIVGKTRDKPIGSKLEKILKEAAEATDIDVVFVTSGSQPGTHGRSTGSTRHNNGRAADLQLIRNGSTLTFTDSNGAKVAPFITACAARGTNGIGAGVGYMGNRTIHVGFGTSSSDHTKLTWGAGGASANAPQWLRNAAKAGWDNPVSGVSVESTGVAAFDADMLMAAASGFVVAARNGLQLRNGPGTEYGIARTLDAGTQLGVLGFDGERGEWARVDLVGDGLADGHVLAAFLMQAQTIEASEDVEEPA